MWHADGLDKLKPYGIAVHGCIDGCININYAQNGTVGMPMIHRSDCGTDNTNLGFIQPYLRRNHADCFSDMGSFRYGKSTANQVSCIMY